MVSQSFLPPRSRADWRTLALRLAELTPDQWPARDRSTLDQLKDLTWDVASYAAFWHTVQLPSMGPGLLPWVVIALASAGPLMAGQFPPSGWPNLSDPFILWPSLWLVGWYALTLGLAALRHRRAKRQVLQLGTRLGLFPISAKSA
jgi:hypothetical protein